MKATSKKADSTMAQLASVMQRNTELATSKEVMAQPGGPVATYTPQPIVSRAIRPVRSRTLGLRLRPDDDAKIRSVIQAGLSLQVRLVVADVIHLALEAYDPKQLTMTAVATLRARDGRYKARQAEQSSELAMTVPQ